MNNSYIYNLEQIKDIENLELIAKFVIEGFITGLHKSPYHGFSVEFSEHRPYSPGESIRFIDWKLYAKTERLYVKKFEDETNLRSWFILDTSTSMLFPYKEFNKNSKLYFSIVCISALINLLKTQRDAVGLICFSNNIELFTKAKLSEVHINYLFTELKKLLKKDAAMREKAAYLLSLVGLKGMEAKVVSSLSFGNQRLVELVRALMSDPEVLLLDEPASGLNEFEVSQIKDTILSLKEKGITVVIVEHNIKMVMEIADEIVVLNFGRKIAEGSPFDILNNKDVLEAYLGSKEKWVTM